MHDTFYQRCFNDANMLGEIHVSVTAYKLPHSLFTQNANCHL